MDQDCYPRHYNLSEALDDIESDLNWIERYIQPPCPFGENPFLRRAKMFNLGQRLLGLAMTAGADAPLREP